MLASLVGGMAAFTAAQAEAQMSSVNASVPAAPSATDSPPDADYDSPYALNFSFDETLLDAGFDQAPWDDPDAEAAQPVAAWQAANAGRRGAAWGPPARQYPAPALPRSDDAYRRERVLAVAARHIGLAYQHHHIPSWAAPAGWPWIEVEAGNSGPGLDCSNFTSFVFNYAIGIKLPTGVGAQGRTTVLRGPGGIGCLRAQRLVVKTYASLSGSLAPADLLYMRDQQGRIRHVVLWLGAVGQDPKGDPLVLDSSQRVHLDANGVAIPIGVRLRPFREQGWYWRNFSHAHRIIGADTPGCEAPPPSFAEGGDLA